MACGVPQIVSDWGGYKETVVNETTGFRVSTYWCKCDNDISCNPFIEDYDFFHPMAGSHLALAESVVVDLDFMEHAIRDLEALCNNADVIYRSVMYLIKHGYARLLKYE